MSKLSDLYSLMPILTVAVMVFNGKHLTQKEQAYIRLFIRLIDKALYEYSIARDAVNAGIEEFKGKLKKIPSNLRPIIIGGRPLFIFDFVDHMETCLNTIRRLYGLKDTIDNERGGLEQMERLKRKFVEAHFYELTSMRGVIQHMDDDIQQGKFKGPVALTMSENDEEVEISDCSIRFTDIEGVLSRFHEIAKKWLDDFDKHEKS
jgi:hypothetical protein